MIVDSLIAGLSTRDDDAYEMHGMFGVIWRYLSLTGKVLYCKAIQRQIERMLHLKSIYATNFREESLSPHFLLNKNSEFKLDE